MRHAPEGVMAGAGQERRGLIHVSLLVNIGSFDMCRRHLSRCLNNLVAVLLAVCYVYDLTCPTPYRSAEH